MKKYAFTSNVIYEQNQTNVDTQNGVIRNVVLAKMGANKNGTYFSERFLNELLEAGQNAPHGIKARFGHPNMCATSLGSFIGNYKNFRIENNAIYGDLFLDEITKKTQVEGRGISMYDYITEMASKNPHFFGNSIHISAYDVEEKIINENNEEETFTGHKLDYWIASDLVDDPAATDSLFSGVEDLGTKTTKFLDTNPQVFDVVEKNPQILLDFFERYENYTNRKYSKSNKKMSLLDKLKNVFSKKYDIDLTLGNGDIITIETEADTPQVGDPVKNNEGKPLEDGDYLLADGKTLVVKEGIIAEIKEAEENPTTEPTPETSEDVKQSIEVLSKKIDALTKSFSTFQKNESKNNQEHEAMVDALLQLDKKFEKLAKGVKSNYEAFQPQGEGLQSGKVDHAPSVEDLRKAREEYKK